MVYLVNSYALVVTLADTKPRRDITASAHLKQGFSLFCTYYMFHEFYFAESCFALVSLLFGFGGYSFFKKGLFAFKLIGKKPDREREAR